MKIIFLILLMMSPSLFAELPLSVSEYIFGISGLSNYVGFCSNDGIKKFDNRVFFFSEANVKTAQIKDLLPGKRNLYSILMYTNFIAKINQTEEVCGKFYNMRENLCRKFDSKKISEIQKKDNCLVFSGKDIDGLRWDVFATAVKSNDQWYVRCNFINECHKAGKFISCEDFAIEEQ